MSSKRKNLFARVMAVAAVVCVAVALTGCSALDALNINQNTKPQKELTPTLDAGATLAEGTLTVGINAANSPYGGTNNNNETVGLDKDIAAAIADELGLKLQIVDVNSNGKAALSEGQIDLALGMTKSGSSGTVTYTDAYLNDGSCLFTTSANAEKAADDMKKFDKTKNKILVQGNTATALEVQESLGMEAVIACSTMKEAFEALEAGDQKYLAADAVIGDYMAANYPDIVRVNFLSSESVTPIYGVTLSSNVELTQGVSKALGAIQGNGIMRVIVDKWLGEQGEQLLPGEVDIAAIPDMFKRK